MNAPGGFAVPRHPAPTSAHRTPSRTGAAPITEPPLGFADLSTLPRPLHTELSMPADRTPKREPGAGASTAAKPAKKRKTESWTPGAWPSPPARDGVAEDAPAEEELMLVRAVIDLALSNIPALVRAPRLPAYDADGDHPARSLGPQGTARQLFREHEAAQPAQPLREVGQALSRLSRKRHVPSTKRVQAAPAMNSDAGVLPPAKAPPCVLAGSDEPMTGQPLHSSRRWGRWSVHPVRFALRLIDSLIAPGDEALLCLRRCRRCRRFVRHHIHRSLTIMVTELFVRVLQALRLRPACTANGQARDDGGGEGAAGETHQAQEARRVLDAGGRARAGAGALRAGPQQHPAPARALRPQGQEDESGRELQAACSAQTLREGRFFERHVRSAAQARLRNGRMDLMMYAWCDV
ncbi:hypothetical protein FA09DRAFT_242673 [Tilletiopsis washingtonensis]|uniref:Uncharacterized protein n=1 Tax=Tilletiopsis washingtonensis TaxID=58919 RepID=A0A316ZCT0_9BASI|nr:hypothetical protein FA09DRAFT_242673 [Tilletiopsis washingtonensis]PWN99126.1 hypothetical protein FA09DRAFT_242673 [Tilletiopsis washingtonensis]